MLEMLLLCPRKLYILKVRLALMAVTQGMVQIKASEREHIRVVEAVMVV